MVVLIMDGDDDKIQVDFAQQRSELNDQVSIQKEKKKNIFPHPISRNR